MGQAEIAMGAATVLPLHFAAQSDEALGAIVVEHLGTTAGFRSGPVIPPLADPNNRTGAFSSTAALLFSSTAGNLRHLRCRVLHPLVLQPGVLKNLEKHIFNIRAIFE